MQTNSSIESSFQFISYKIDEIRFELEPRTKFLFDDVNGYKANMSFNFRDPNKFVVEDNIFYVSGLSIRLIISDSDDKKMAEGHFSISGIFSSLNQFSKKDEENLAKVQIPAILFPYLRSAITNILASSGFHSIILPLVNIQEAAKNSPIKIIDKTNS